MVDVDQTKKPKEAPWQRLEVAPVFMKFGDSSHGISIRTRGTTGIVVADAIKIGHCVDVSGPTTTTTTEATTTTTKKVKTTTEPTTTKKEKTTTSEPPTTTTVQTVNVQQLDVPDLDNMGTPLVRINCGGPGFSDKNENLFVGDVFFQNGIANAEDSLKIKKTKVNCCPYRSNLASQLMGPAALRWSVHCGVQASCTCFGDVNASLAFLPPPFPQDDFLYQSERWAPVESGENLIYNIPVSKSGKYNVVLHFAEIYPGNAKKGARVFDILMEGKMAIEAFDIQQEVGFAEALQRAFQVKVKDGILNLEMAHVTENPKISAIEVYADPSLGDVTTTIPEISSTSTAATTTDATTAASTTTPSPVITDAPEAVLRINCGGSVFTDSNGNVWSGDDFFTGGDIFDVATPVQGTKDSLLFQTERYGIADAGLFSYSLNVPNGKYTVRLYFAEIFVFNDFAGLRQFDVTIEGQKVLAAYDIVADVGFNTAVIKEFPVTVTGGDLAIVFSFTTNPTMDGPKIGAIEVLEA